MEKNFWQALDKPFLVQAPLDGVTDVVFREILSRVGKPDVYFTEFTNVDGLMSKGSENVKKRLEYTKKQRPIVAQIWGLSIENYKKAAQLIRELGFDGIDINMGCPDRVIVKKGCCSGLMHTPDLAKQIIDATRDGANGLPVSVKTRIGYDRIETREWIGFLLEQNLAALIVHGRIATEMSKFPANWEEIGKVVMMRDKQNPGTLIIGNGDVLSREDSLQKVKMYGVDGVMIGRGVFHNLSIFTKKTNLALSQKEKLQLLIEHISLFISTWSQDRNNPNFRPFELMKKFYKVYVNGLPNANEFRMILMSCKTPEETIEKVKEALEAE